uniref:Integrase catalytic domain-containing protein n=1 Tax=Acanthochromis polyacanthus TaxID=80966 RepID=A0A3Q1EX79_9TELE
YWTDSLEFIGLEKKYVLSCVACQLTKPTNRKPASYMQPVVASYPWEFVGVDFVGPLPRSTHGNEYILVFIDYFTRWVEICPVREATAGVAAHKFISEVFARHGAPKYLVSDRGVQFASVFSFFFNQCLHRWNERVNRMIKTAIWAYVESRQKEWDLHLPHISFALRTAPHQSTGETPAFLLYGRDLNTPLDLWMQPDTLCAPESMESYKSELTSSLQDAYDHVREAMASSHDTQKKHYNKKRCHATFNVGDLVRLRSHPRSNAAAGFAPKLAPVFKGSYRVIQVMSDLDYRLVDIFSDEDIGVHHVSNLLPFKTWGDGTVAPHTIAHCMTDVDPATSETEETEELEEYGFDFLFGDPPSAPSVDSIVTPFGPSDSVSHSHTSRYFLRPGNKPQVALG